MWSRLLICSLLTPSVFVAAEWEPFESGLTCSEAILPLVFEPHVRGRTRKPLTAPDNPVRGSGLQTGPQ